MAVQDFSVYVPPSVTAGKACFYQITAKIKRAFTCGSGTLPLQRAVQCAQHIKSSSAQKLCGLYGGQTCFDTPPFFSTTLQTSSDGCLVSSVQETLCQDHKRPYAERQLQMRSSLRVQSFGWTVEEGYKHSYYSNRTFGLAFADMQVPYGHNSDYMKMKTLSLC